MISLGGWTGSNLFSNAVSTPSNMRTFVNNIVAMAVKHKVDGVDLDWFVSFSSDHLSATDFSPFS